MRYLFGLAVAGALVVGTTSDARAQFSISIGNPYTGQGVSIGNNTLGYGGYGSGGYLSNGYAGGYGSGGYLSNGYGGGYYGGYAPSTRVYSSGYSGYSPPVYGPVIRSYPAYGYGGYGNGPATRYVLPFNGLRMFRR